LIKLNPDLASVALLSQQALTHIKERKRKRKELCLRYLSGPTRPGIRTAIMSKNKRLKPTMKHR
jgi:hypothetical protein